jgi:hypothetical protein
VARHEVARRIPAEQALRKEPRVEVGLVVRDAGCPKVLACGRDQGVNRHDVTRPSRA